MLRFHYVPLDRGGMLAGGLLGAFVGAVNAKLQIKW
jgi:hypothetical protein